MATDWVAARNAALAAGKSALGSAWEAASSGASAQITALVNIAQYIQDNQASMTTDEVTHLVAQQKVALQNVLMGYAAISIAGATNAVAAVVNSIAQAAPGLLGFV
jgi:transketolase N-terminal domain/subunit